MDFLPPHLCTRKKSRVISAERGPTNGTSRHPPEPSAFSRSFAKVFVAQMGSLIGEYGSVIVLNPGSAKKRPTYDWIRMFWAFLGKVLS